MPSTTRSEPRLAVVASNGSKVARRRLDCPTMAGTFPLGQPRFERIDGPSESAANLDRRAELVHEREVLRSTAVSVVNEHRSENCPVSEYARGHGDRSDGGCTALHLAAQGPGIDTSESHGRQSVLGQTPCESVLLLLDSGVEAITDVELGRHNNGLR